MQLRVARLCLDCEEVFANGDTCPICASTHHAFLRQWLPVDERRKRQGRKPGRDRAQPGLAGQWARRLAAWFSGGVMPEAPAPDTMPRTRASDHMPRLDFDEKAPAPPSTAPQVARTNEQ
jgi:hypothetical protein